MYCITNKVVNILNETNYKIGWVGKEKPPNHYILCNSKDNIFYKEKYYSELTFQYWFWKNLLDTGNPNWIGFCQKRRFWIKPEKCSGSTAQLLACVTPWQAWTRRWMRFGCGIR